MRWGEAVKSFKNKHQKFKINSIKDRKPMKGVKNRSDMHTSVSVGQKKKYIYIFS